MNQATGSDRESRVPVPICEAAEEFLAQKRIGVAGVSRDEKQTANLIFRRLRDAGHDVFPINPNADEVEGVRCFGTVGEIEGGLDGVLVVTTSEVAETIVEDCAAAGVPRVWLHRGPGKGSMSDAAVDACHAHGIAVIPGGCPNMFGETADGFHKCLRMMQRATGKLPARV